MVVPLCSGKALEPYFFIEKIYLQVIAIVFFKNHVQTYNKQVELHLKWTVQSHQERLVFITEHYKQTFKEYILGVIYCMKG